MMSPMAGCFARCRPFWPKGFYATRAPFTGCRRDSIQHTRPACIPSDVPAPMAGLTEYTRDAYASAPESAHQQWGGSPHRTEHWMSVAEGNCVAERRGGEQPEANDQSIIKKMMNSIRPDALASLLVKGEAQNGSRPGKGTAATSRPDLRQAVSVGTGVHGVGGDRMVGSWSDMNQGSRIGKGTAFMTGRGSEEPCPKGDRAFVVAKKRGNARGAKGGRKVEA